MSGAKKSPKNLDKQKILEQLTALKRVNEALRERESRLLELYDSDPLAAFEPTKPEHCQYGDAQILFFQTKAKEIVLFGGNRSGKTQCGAARLCFHITGKYPDWFAKESRILDGEERKRPLRFRVFSTGYEKGVNEVVWPKIISLLPRDLRVEPKRNPSGGIVCAYFKNGVEVSFMTHHQDLDDLVGWSGDGVWMDEPPPSLEFYIEAARGTLDKGGQIWTTATPLDCDWFDEYLLDNSTKDPDERFKVFALRLDIRDNPFIAPEQIDWWLTRLPQESFATRVEGEPTSVKSRVFFRSIDQRLHFVEPFDLPLGMDGKPDGWTLYMSLDPHDSHPAAMVWWAVFDPAQTGGVSRVVQVAESFDQRCMTISGVVEVAREVEAKLGATPAMRFIDPNFGAKKSTVTGRRIYEEYAIQSREMGYPMVFQLANDKVAYGHWQIRGMLERRLPDGSPQLVFFNTCQATIRSLLKYRYKDMERGTVENNNYKHFPDCLRYLATAPIRFLPSKSAKSFSKVIKEELLSLEEDSNGRANGSRRILSVKDRLKLHGLV